MGYYSPAEMTEAFRSSGIYKGNLPIVKFMIIAILGGAFIALGGLLSVMVAGGMSGVASGNPGLIKFMAGALFPVGLMMVSVTGADLFTSDCAAFTMPLCKKEISTSKFIRFLLLSYCFNFIGTQFIAWLLTYYTGILSHEPWLNYLHTYSDAKVNQDFLKVFIKGIGANWLVCLGMFMGYAAKDISGKCIGIWIPVMLFVTLGFEHSIANMFFIPAAIYTGAPITWVEFIIQNLIPATLGNFVGGAVLVGGIYTYLFIDKSCK